MSRRELKNQEKLYTSKYMEYVYGYKPKFIDTAIDIPDCYFRYIEKYYAIEVTRYFQQNSEKNDIIFSYIYF